MTKLQDKVEQMEAEMRRLNREKDQVNIAREQLLNE
jgi:hypothetical protein